MAEDEDDPAVFWPLFETTVNDEAEFGEDVGFVRDSTRRDAMRCDAMTRVRGWWDEGATTARRRARREAGFARRRGRTGEARGERQSEESVGFVDD